MQETEADAMYDNGKISAATRKAISNIGGHSDLTVKNYYVKKRRRQDAEDGQYMFDVIGQANPLSSDSWFSEDDCYEHNNFDLPNENSTSDTFRDEEGYQALPPTPHHAQYTPPPNSHWQSPPTKQWKGEISWGQNHPEYNSPKTRIPWSDEENDYIKRWWMEHGSAYHTNVAARLLAHIRNDPDAHAIFHSNHILDSARVRHGLRLNGFNK